MKPLALPCPFDHSALNYHGHSNCLNDHAEAGPYYWMVWTWPCQACGGRFARMLAAEGLNPDGDWSGATSVGVTFEVPFPKAERPTRPSAVGCPQAVDTDRRGRCISDWGTFEADVCGRPTDPGSHFCPFCIRASRRADQARQERSQ